jgi:ubiquinone/menaquinone biosynthesis C-methylase UbiE
VLLNKASKVYCVDINDYAINMAKENIKDERAIFLNEDASSTSIPNSSVDLVIMVNAFHDMENKNKVALEVSRILKQGGLVLIIESKPGLASYGPPPWLRMSPDDVIKYFNNPQFKVEGIKDLGDFNAILIKKI